MIAGPGRFCVFCGSSGPLNKAHVVARSFLTRLAKSDGGLRQTNTRRHSLRGDLIESVKESDRDPRERVARVTCHECNGQWMAGVEEAVRDLVIDIAGNIRVELNQRNSSAIALWVAAAGVLAGKLGDGPDFVSEDGAHLRAENALPSGFKVWLIYGNEPRDDLFSQHRSGLTRHGASWLAWFWIGHAVFMVASEGAGRLLDGRLRDIGPVVQQLHPPQPGSSKWPPPAASFTGGITSEHLHKLASL